MKYPGRLIKQGEKDKAIVKALQQSLKDLGIDPGAIDGDFGKTTKSAVQYFQSTNVDENGNPLVADGVVGAITWQVLFGKKTVPENSKPQGRLMKKAIEVARSQIGIMEKPPGSNAGKEVEMYLASTGLGKGYAWCMAFVYYVFNEAAKELGISNPLVKTAGCLTQWNKTTCRKIKKAEAVANPALIVPGSIFIMDFGSGLGHTGIVVSVSGGFITTIEGNTNNSGSRTGIGVFELSHRKINSVNKGFIIASE
ncbi:CHAP domain-containing protein [Polluticaenibacter yanchengensis]|uniref:CHAP domain-containing protein n=1 Tax=Polluticaenibacter yanchengensis TaxID=3014562 RepID=A0ABT4UNF6_9BACT|nr:CHAP domain-containing protein [Chitinophagaceae bacterium LY-5]